MKKPLNDDNEQFSVFRNLALVKFHRTEEKKDKILTIERNMKDGPLSGKLEDFKGSYEHFTWLAGLW